MKKLKMSAEDYHRHPAVGSTSLRILIDQTPAHYLHSRENPSESTDAQEFGQMIHTAILEPDVFANLATVEPEFSGKGMREAKENWHIENHGKIILKRAQKIMIEGMIKSIQSHPLGRKLLAAGRAEESLFWTDPETGVECKGRFDFTHDNQFLVDVKSTQDAAHLSFIKDIANYGYYIQAAHYLEGAQAVLGTQFREFLILAIEKSAPHCCRVFRIGESSIHEAKALRFQALKSLAACIKAGKFHGYPEDIFNADIPTWAYRTEP